MKKYVLFSILLFTMILIFGEWVGVNSDAPAVITQEVISQTYDAMTVRVNVPGVEISKKQMNGAEYNILRIPEASYILEEGMPELPKSAFSMIIADDGVMDLRVKSVQYEEFYIGMIIPSKGNLKRNVNPDDIAYKWDEVYTKDAYYPNNNVELSEPFIIRDFRGVTVTMYPVQYNPVTQTIRVIKSMDIEVFRSAPGGINTINSRKSSSDAGFNEIYSNFFINFKKEQSKYTFLSDEAGNMLVISAAGYMDNLSDWLFWKKKKGIDYELVNVNDIGNNSTAIKTYIQNKYDSEGVTWVVLVGNGTDVATIAGSYDNTCDPVYAYLAGGDNYPDCYIARISGNSEANIDIQMEKFLTYERYPEDGADWYQHACGTATEEGDPTDEERLTWVNDTLLAYTYTTADYIGESWADDADVINALNDGRSILNHIGHGNETGFGTNTAFWITGTMIKALTNYNQLTFGYMCACLIGDFTAATECLCESWMWAGTAGNPTAGFAIYGSSVNQSWVPPTNSQLHANGLLKRELTTSVGGMCYNGSMYMLEVDGDLEMIQTWHIFGDPSIDLYTYTPDTLEVNHEEFIPTGAYPMVIEVLDDDGVTPIEGALVCAWGQTETDMYVTGYTDASGEVTLNTDCSVDMDTIYITVTKHNYKPHEGYAIVGVGLPKKPVLKGYFNFARVPTLNPTLSFNSIDEENDNVMYTIMIDNDMDFSSPDSFVTGTYSEGIDADYMLPTALSDNTTYWWKVKAMDPAGSGHWSSYSEVRNFTISTLIGSNNCSWFQNTTEQFNLDTKLNLAVEGDSIVLKPDSIGTEILLDANFEGGSMASGWSASGSSSSAVWGVGATGATNPPPSYGSYYARIYYPSSGPSPSSDTDYLTGPMKAIGTDVTSLTLSYSWGVDVASTDELRTEIRINNGGTWGSWTELIAHTADGSGADTFDLMSYLPGDSIQVRFAFYSPGGRNGQDGAVDNILLEKHFSVQYSYGSLYTKFAFYDDLDNNSVRTNWGYVNWKQSTVQDSVVVHMEYCNNDIWQLIPDGVLTGNSTGFAGCDASGVGSFSLGSINTSTYDSIRGVFNVFRKGTKSSTEPCIDYIEIGSNLSMSVGINDISLVCSSTEEGVLLNWMYSSTQANTILKIERSENKQNYMTIAEADGKDNAYLDRTAQSGKTYYYRVSAMTDTGMKVFGPVKVITGIMPGVFAISADNSVISDNASITYHVPEKAMVSIDLYDITGRKVMDLFSGNRERGIYGISIPTDNIPSGTYFVILKSGDTLLKAKTTIIR